MMHETTPFPIDREFSVSELSQTIKTFVETAFSRVRVKGEISGCKRADSGHWYFSLKDDSAVLAAVCWKGLAAGLAAKPEDGLEVVVTGKITTFPGKSSYQIVVEQMEVAGLGALLKLLEERKQKFAAEGLFDAAHKRKIPFMPQTVGVVTSLGGAVIRDIIHRISDRFPTHILVIPTPVQGVGAAEKIAAAIGQFNKLERPLRPDVLIVARGGGSLEDLWCFNEEIVVRAVYDSKIPIISAVGHETDTMLIDYAADLRAPTPTGAAEFAVPVKRELEAKIQGLAARLTGALPRFFDAHRTRLEGLARGIPDLRQILFESEQKLDDRLERLKLSFNNLIERKELMLENFKPRLNSVSIESVLRRGFAWVRGDTGQTLYTKSQAQNSPSLEIRFADGSVKISNQKKQEKKNAPNRQTAFDFGSAP